MTAAAFKRALEQLGLTPQRVAADRLGAPSRQRVGEWERGERPVPPAIAAHVHTLQAHRAQERGNG